LERIMQRTLTDICEARISVPALLVDVQEWRRTTTTVHGKAVTTRAMFDELFLLRDEAAADGATAMVDRLGEVIYRLSEGFAGKYAARWVGDLDLFEEVLSSARLGLWEAVGTYRVGRAAWSSWAVIHVKKRALEAAWRGLPQRSLSRQAFRSRPAILAEMLVMEQASPGSRPDVAVLADRLGLTVGTVRQVVFARSQVSLDSPARDSEDGGSWQDRFVDEGLSPDDSAVANADRERLREALGGLPALQREALMLSFGFDGGVCRGFADIAEVLGLSVGVVRGLLGDGLSGLRGVLGGGGVSC
jgi:RNA polymerase sigma factor (sigma-70 family)